MNIINKIIKAFTTRWKHIYAQGIHREGVDCSCNPKIDWDKGEIRHNKLL